LGWLGLLGAFDALFGILCFVVFEFVFLVPCGVLLDQHWAEQDGGRRGRVAASVPDEPQLYEGR